MHFCTIARRLLAATTLFLAVAAAPAFGQADLEAAITLDGEGTFRGLGFTLGGAESYTIKVTNHGPTHVTEFTIDATIPDPLVQSADDLAALATKCAPVGATPFPCVVKPASALIAGGSHSISFGVSYPAPDPLVPATETCPGGAVQVTSDATVSGGMQGTTAIADPVPTNDTGSTINELRDWADLEVVSVDGPANASEGQTIQYTVVVRNNGPCGANDVFVDFPAPFTLTLQSVTGDCTNASTFGTADDAGCDLGIDLDNATRLPVGTATFTATYTVNTFPSDVIHAALPIEVAISSVSATSAVTATDDPISEGNVKKTVAQVDLSSNEGCSTGGAGTLFGLLSLVALRFGRRRSS